MPTISEFYGIRVSINFIKSEHNPPHIHIRYGDTAGTMAIRTFKILDGDLSKQTVKIVLEWVTKYQKELLNIWETQTFAKLPPLE